MATLDLLDRKILFELDHNSRQPVSNIARKLRQGRDRIDYRIERLLDQGIVKGFSAIVDPYKYGVSIYKTYVKVESNKERRDACLDYLRSHPRIYWIAESDGTWDLMFSYFANDVKEFDELQDLTLSKFSDILLEFQVYPLVDLFLFKKNYLLNKGSAYEQVGGHIQSYKLDTIDREILKLLAANARISVVEISDRLDTTPTVVKYRIEKLEHANIIKGYRIDLDLPKLSMVFFKAQLYLRTYKPSAEEKFFEFCRQHPHITYYIRQIGSCKLEIELEVEDYYQFYSIIEEMRQLFYKFLRNIESNSIRREYFNWVPDA